MTVLSIMIAEPDLIVAKSMERLLLAKGQSVIAITTTGAALLKEAGKHPPDLVLVNTRLKDGMTGIDVARILNDTFDVPSILIAAYPDEILQSEVDKADIYGYLIKPFNEKNLLLAVRTASLLYRRESEIRRSCDYLKRIIATLDEAIIATDSRHRITFMNHEAEKLTGCNAGEVRSADICDVFCPTRVTVGTSPSGKSAGKSNRSLPFGHPGTESMRSKSGETYIISHSVAPIHDSLNRETGSIHMFRDISHAFAAEEKILKEQKLASLGILAGGLAHDLNNILTTMMGYLSLCRMSIPDGPADTHLRKLEKNIFRIKDVAQQLLTFTRGGMPVRRNVPIQPIVSSAIRSASTSPKVLYDLNLPDDLWQVFIDENQIILSLRNLIWNASQAMHGEGTIRISGCNRAIFDDDKTDNNPHRFVRISVSDHGIGIERDQLEKIFDPYVTTKSGCSGIGLTVVHSVLERHGGQVIAESEPGRGSTFHLLLPAAGTGSMVSVAKSRENNPLREKGTMK